MSRPGSFSGMSRSVSHVRVQERVPILASENLPHAILGDVHKLATNYGLSADPREEAALQRMVSMFFILAAQLAPVGSRAARTQAATS